MTKQYETRWGVGNKQLHAATKLQTHQKNIPASFYELKLWTVSELFVFL